MDLDDSVALLVNGRPQDHIKLSVEEAGYELITRSQFYADEETGWFWDHITPLKSVTLKIGDELVSEGVINWTGTTFLSSGKCLVRWIHTGKPTEKQDETG